MEESKKKITKEEIEYDKCLYCAYYEAPHKFCHDERKCKRSYEYYDQEEFKDSITDGFLLDVRKYELIKKESETKTNNVNHPKHYAKHYDGICSLECIEAMLVTYGTDAVYNFCVCNAFKYLWRHKNKNGLEDLEKAEWYTHKAIELNGFITNQLEQFERIIEEHKERYKNESEA